ncbi:hypothetical protein [Pseudomonas sp. NPDC007930]|uniref:hypothetical protein n=1 Tax=Pseudomonas sp. NPDC007930 TaxID=3364417 RepID=UPI0036F17532
MNTRRLTSFCLSALLGLSCASAFADASTGTTNPAPKGTNPSSVGVPSGTGTAMPNGNTDGSAAPREPTSGDVLKPQSGGNPEGSSMGGATQPNNGMGGMKDGNGGEGGKAGGASQ